MRRPLVSTWRPLLAAGLSFALPTILGGCHDDSARPEARTAERAVGIDPERSKRSTTVTRDVNVITDVKVQDPKTGRILSEKVERAPVKITEETRKDVKVEVGETRATAK
jgi:hypothetical protein